MLEALRWADLVIPEDSWEQGVDDIINYKVDVVVMGVDRKGSDRFEYLRNWCELVFLDRIEGISSTGVKACLRNAEGRRHLVW